MIRIPAPLIALAGLIAALSAFADPPAGGDPVSTPPPAWSERLLAIPDADLSGTEETMREAIAAAREEVARRIQATDPDGDTGPLAAAYGRLGALFVLLEIEALADAAFRNARVLDPREVRWPYYAGYMAMLFGNTERAIALLEAARTLAPDYAPIALRLGKTRLDSGDLPGARADLEVAVREPGLAAAAEFYLGQIANLERRHEDAVGHLETALAADPNATQAHWALAQAYRALGQDTLAREHMSQAAPRTPDAEDPLLAELKAAGQRSIPAFERGLHAVRSGEYVRALDEFRVGLGVDPDNQAARVSYARALYLAGEVEAARQELDRILGSGDAPALAIFLDGVLAESTGNTEVARTRYRETLAADPRHLGALFNLANLDLRAGDHGAAASGYRAALDTDEPPPPARLLALIAARRAGLSERETAEGLDAVIAESQGDPAARYAQIRLLALAADPQVCDPERAIALASRLAFEQPGPNALRALAIAQAASGDLESAAHTQQQAIATAGGWLPPALLEAMTAELTAMTDGRLPAPPWPDDDPLLAPPPTDATRTFRDYPAAVPY